jgi:beta-barrel assembly-enhancing protease
MTTHWSRRAVVEWAVRAGLAGMCAGPLLGVLGGLLSGCKAAQMAAEVGQAAGVLDAQQAQSVIRVGGAMARGFEDITPEQEYYIGRTVAAVILSSYRPYANQEANAYVNLIGSLASLNSELPETFGGYHFLILDSDEINAFAAPGGLILVTRGMLRCCDSEDAVAAVLAHEIGHIAHHHGIQTIRSSRLTSAFTILAAEGAKNLGGRDLAELTQAFERSVSDVVGTLVTNGYSRGAEREADQAAAVILRRTGYEASALIRMLEIMDQRLHPGGPDFAKTHPSPRSRISDLRGRTDPWDAARANIRMQRFRRALHGV